LLYNIQMNDRTLSYNTIDELQVKLHSVGYAKLDQEWNYAKISSSFSRIYLIEEGEGYILPNNVMYQLKPGYLYLVPSFTLCGYHCVSSLSQYYLHLSNELPTGLNIYDFFNINNQVEAHGYEKQLFEQLIALNRKSALQQSDPSTYESRSWKPIVPTVSSCKAYLETIGIMKQLLSRFIATPKDETRNTQQFIAFRKVFQYINQNIENEIRIETLARLSNYSYDHFIRLFRKTTGQLPMAYINSKRVEKAQTLLLTTNMGLKAICDMAGFNHLTYFYRVFQKHTGITPAQYRRLGGLI